MKKIFQFAIVLFIISTNVKAQMVGTDIFLKGDYVEVGIADNGSYGSGSNAPTGYHPKPDFGLTSGPIGFVADPSKDGWSVSGPGMPDYFGDYFMPGTPQEGWDVEVNGTRGRAWRMSGATSFTGTLTGSNTSYSTVGTQYIGVWDGTMGNLSIKQTTTQKKDKVYFVTNIQLKNTGTTTLTNIYYNRSLDPEPDATIGGNYASDKRIIYQPTTLSKNCLVVAIGQDYDSAYVGLGSKDCRAKCYITNSYTPDASLSSVYGQNGSASGYKYAVNSFSAANTSMGIVFNVGSLGPGESTELSYAYILKQADLDSALNETAPSFISDSVEYKAYTTFRVCPGTVIPLKVKGGRAYKWIWTPATSLSADSLISPSPLYPDGAAFGDSVSVTVNGPKTYTATGVSICDTLKLVFYVDTINFSVPPFVTGPVTYCQGATASALTASGASGATIWWSTSVGGTETTVAPTPSTATAGTTRYFVRQQNTLGCYSQYAYIDVIVIAKPEPPGVHDTVYCYGQTTVPLEAFGTNIKWYDALTGGTKYASTPTPSSTGTQSLYYPSQTINGCESDRATLTVNIAKITADFTIVKDSLCGDELMTVKNNSDYTFAGATTPYFSYWTFGDGDTSTNQEPTHSYKNLGLYTVKLIVSEPHKCADSMTKKVYIAPAVELDFTRSDTLICQGGAIDFEAHLTPGYYQTMWDFDDGDVNTYNDLKVRQAFPGSGVHNVKFKGFYSICGEKEVTHPVTITEIPKVDIGRDTSICPNNEPLVLKNYNPAHPDSKYMWSTGDTTTQIYVRGEGEYWLRLMDGQCSSKDSIMVSKACYLDIPNAFNPSDPDPINHYFMPRDFLSKSLTTFEMKIWDRWGQQIFESHSTNGRGWDGTYKGQAQPYGVYVYYIKASFANGIIEEYKGNVTLIR